MLDGNSLGAIGELEWLKNGLLTSSARWKIVFTSVITNPTTKQDDAWGAYPTEWNALKSFILTNNIKNVVFIAGDLHLGAIDNGTQAGFPEMCVAQANETDTGFCASAPRGRWSEGYFDDTCAGYGLVTVLQNPDRLILQIADQNGIIHIAYTVNNEAPTPTPTATPAPPSITTQPADRTVNVGETATFTVSATGSPPLHYQWRKNGVNIPGATNSSYTTPATVAADNGSLFSVIVSNRGGSVTSNNATLTVRTPPTITTQPADQTVRAGQRARFSVTATGTLPLHYRWRKNGVNIPGATKASYTTPPTTAEDNGALFAVTVSNLAGSVTSNNATLTVQ